MATAEHHVEHHSVTGVDNRKLLMWIFLGSECLFFGALISTYLIFKADIPAPNLSFIEAHTHVENGHEVVTGWFPADRVVDGVQYAGVLDIPITSQSTFVLLMSSVTMVLAVYGAQHGRLLMMKAWLLATVLLGLMFLGYQVYEFRTFGQEGLDAGHQPVRRLVLRPDRLPRDARRRWGSDPRFAAAGIVQAQRTRTGGRLPYRNRRPLLALRRYRLDRDLHDHLPDTGLIVAEGPIRREWSAR